MFLSSESWLNIWAFPQVGDFAILLRAGFDRWTAAKLQFSTALGGLLGACFAICTQSPKGVGTRVVDSGVQEVDKPKGTFALLLLGKCLPGVPCRRVGHIQCPELTTS